MMAQAGEQEIDLFQMKEGENVTFVALASNQAARATQAVTITKGPLYRYQDYDLGTYVTEPYFISYGNVHATAYCIQPSLPGPGTGTYTITKLRIIRHLQRSAIMGQKRQEKKVILQNITVIFRRKAVYPYAYSGSVCLWKCRCLLWSKWNSKIFGNGNLQLLCRKAGNSRDFHVFF